MSKFVITAARPKAAIFNTDKPADMKGKKTDLNDLQDLETNRIKINDKGSRLRPWLIVSPLLAFAAVHFFLPGPLSFIAGGLAILAGIIAYQTGIVQPFKRLKTQAREILLADFMAKNHSSISFDYFPGRQDVKSIIKQSQLITANIFKEEDVIQGQMKDADFYLSEIHLMQSSGKNTHSVFKGILFKLKLPGRNFSTSQIQSKVGLLSRLFRGFKKHEEFGFSYETDDEMGFFDSLASLFPFIQHLMTNSKDLRIKTQGDEITILMGSKMKFLDDPKPKLTKSLINETYNENLGRQLNSLLFIVDAFVNNLGKEEIEEELDTLVLKQAVRLKSEL